MSISGCIAELEQRILVLTSWESNAKMLGRVLDGAGLPYHICPSVEALVAEVANGVGAMLLAVPMLSPAESLRLKQMFERQPLWSQPSLVLIIDEENWTGGPPEWVRQINGRASVIFLAQPVRSFTLVSTLQAALKARRHQYAMRDLQANLEERVEERTQQVRRLDAQLSLVEGQERKRIAHILHDNLQPMLYGLQFLIKGLRTQAESPDPIVLEQIEEILTETVQTTRTLSVDLHPPVLETGGLAQSLTWLAEHMAERHGLEVTMNIQDKGEEVSKELRILIFENVRELLFNVIKHADVDHACVCVEYSDGQMIVSVEDQGQGMDLDTLSPPTDIQRSRGLHSVRNRVLLLGGEVKIHSTPGAGTKVTLFLPQ